MEDTPVTPVTPGVTRPLARVIDSVAASDGAGVKLQRSLGRAPALRLDPLLMLDEFFSDDPDDYLAGFPSHPHRGFETVTYMLDGHMRHEDHLGNRGDLGPGAVQWMSAGRGIVHSEMPQQTEGRMRGFQLWVNLPAREKMKAPAWRDIVPEEIPVATLPGGARVRVIAGRVDGAEGPVEGPLAGLTTELVYLDVALPAGARWSQDLPASHNVYLYAYEGNVGVGPAGATRPLGTRCGGVLGEGERVELEAGAKGARVLVIAGRPIGEPIAQYGPFVMNTEAELRQAVEDFRAGRFSG